MPDIKENYHPLLLIRSFKVCGHEVQAYYGAGQILAVRMSLKTLERRIEPYGFVRVHRSYIVNGASVVSYTSKRVKMDDGSEAPLSRSYLKTFDEAMRSQATITVGGTG